MPDYELSDEWRRGEAPRDRPYEPPLSGIFEPEEECVCLRINRKWTPFLTGVIDILTNPALWISEDEEYAPEQIRLLIGALMGEENSMACPPPIDDIIFEDGILKICRGGDCVAIDGTENIVTGVGFVDGGWEVEQGGEFEPISAECEDPCNHYPDTPAYDNSGELRSCAIATNLVTYIMEKYNDSLDSVEVIENSIMALDSVLGFFPPVYLIFDVITDAINEWYDVGISIARLADSTEFREAFTAKLYCALVDNGHVMSSEVWQQITDWEEPVLSLSLYLDAFNYEAIESQAHKASYGEASGCETFDCQCIPAMIDFETTAGYTVTQGAREAATGNGGYAAFESVTSSDPGAGFLVTVEVEIDFGGETTIGEIDYDMKATRTQSPTSANKQFQQWVEGWDGSAWVALFTSTSGDLAAGGEWHARNRSWTPASYSKLRLRIRAGWGSWAVSPETGTLAIDNICIK
jgi:hypothetical protein